MFVQEFTAASCMDSEGESSTANMQPTTTTATGTPAGSVKRKAGRKRFRETRHPVYRGVRERNGGRWVCEVRGPERKSRIWVGTFATPEIAAQAHDIAAIALRGRAATLNFPGSSSALPKASSASPDDIRCAAAKVMRSRASVPSPSPIGIASVGTSEEEEDSAGAFVDEEAIFDMPGLVNGMAEGLLLTPPALQSGFDWNDVETGHMDLSLWRD